MTFSSLSGSQLARVMRRILPDEGVVLLIVLDIYVCYCRGGSLALVAYIIDVLLAWTMVILETEPCS